MPLNRIVSQDFSTFASGNLTGQGGYIAQAGLALNSLQVTGGYLLNKTSGQDSANQNNSAVAAIILSTDDIRITINVRRSDAVAAVGAEYIQFILGDIDNSGLDVVIDCSATGTAINPAWAAPALGHMNISAQDSSGAENDWVGASAPAFTWSGATVAVEFLRIAGAWRVTVGGVWTGRFSTKLDNTLIATNCIQWFAHSDLATPKLNVVSLTIDIYTNWVTKKNDVYTVPPFTAGDLNTQLDWEKQANAAPEGLNVKAGGWIQNGTNNTSICSSYDDTTFAAYNMATSDFQNTIGFKRNNLTAIGAGVIDYIDLLWGNVNIDGHGNGAFIVVGIDFSAAPTQSNNGITVTTDKVAIEIYSDKFGGDIVEIDFDGTMNPQVDAPWANTNSLVWTRIGGTHFLSVLGIDLGPLPGLDNTAITVPDLAWYSLSGLPTTPKTGVTSLLVKLGNTFPYPPVSGYATSAQPLIPLGVL